MVNNIRKRKLCATQTVVVEFLYHIVRLVYGTERAELK